MTKVEAIECVLKENGGSANLTTIYEKIHKFYPKAKGGKEWEAGVRGVLYRDIKDGKRFKKIGLSIYALKDYEPNPLPKANEKVKIHSFMQGICLELGWARHFRDYLKLHRRPVKALRRQCLFKGHRKPKIPAEFHLQRNH